MLLDQRCPGCGRPCTRCPCCAEPEPGQPAVCTNCGEIMVWLDSDTLGKLSDEALALLCLEPE